MLGHWVVWRTGLYTRNIPLRELKCVWKPIDGPAGVVDTFDFFTLVGPIAIIRKPKWTYGGDGITGIIVYRLTHLYRVHLKCFNKHQE